MAYVLVDVFGPQIEDVNGVPMVNGSIEAYVAGTSTPATMYTDSAGTSLGTSCTLNSRGYPQTVGGTEVSIFADTAVVYKFVVKDSAGSTLKTIDPFYPLGLGSAQTVDSFATAYAAAFSGINLVTTRSFYGGWSATVVGPKGGATYHRDGTTGTASTAYADNSGFFDASGDGFTISSYEGVFYTTQFGAKELGVTFDDTTYIQYALNYANSSGVPIVKSVYRPRITASINVPNNVTWDLQNKPGYGSVYRIGTGWEQVGAGELVVAYGSGDSTRTNAAVKLNYGSGFINGSFWYSQDVPTGSTPIVFPPSILFVDSAERQCVDNVNFSNSYWGIDSLDLCANTQITNLTGFPRYRGVAVGKTNGFFRFGNWEFVSSAAFRNGAPPCEAWMVNNALAVYSEYFTWVETTISCFGYRSAFQSRNGTYPFGVTSGSQRSVLTIFADNCPYAVDIEGTVAGLTLEGRVNPANTIDTTIKDGFAVRVVSDDPSATGFADVDCRIRVIGATKDVFIFENLKGVKVNGAVIQQFGQSVTAASLTITGATQANPCVITTSAAHGIYDNDLVYISGVGGMTELNGKHYYVKVLTTTTFQLYKTNSTGYTAYTTGGTADTIPAAAVKFINCENAFFGNGSHITMIVTADQNCAGIVFDGDSATIHADIRDAKASHRQLLILENSINYTLDDCHFNDASGSSWTGLGANLGIRDEAVDSKTSTGICTNVQDDKELVSLSASYLDASGILQIPASAQWVQYTGAGGTTINGLSGRYKNRDLFLLIVNSGVNLTSGANFNLTAGSHASAANERIVLKCSSAGQFWQEP